MELVRKYYTEMYTELKKGLIQITCWFIYNYIQTVGTEIRRLQWSMYMYST